MTNIYAKPKKKKKKNVSNVRIDYNRALEQMIKVGYKLLIEKREY